MARRSSRAAGRVESIQEVETRFLPCRGFRHLRQKHLGDTVTTGPRKKVIQFVRRSRCLDCGTEIEFTIDVPSFRTVRSRYRHPDGYLVVGGASVREARAEYLGRLGYKFDKPDEG